MLLTHFQLPVFSFYKKEKQKYEISSNNYTPLKTENNKSTKLLNRKFI